MIGKLKKFFINHPYLPLIFMAVLDMAGYLMQDNGGTIDFAEVKSRLCKAFSSVREFVAFFPEEIFVAITAYSLGQKMRALKEEEAEVREIVRRLSETGKAMENVWKTKTSTNKNQGADDDVKRKIGK